MDEFAQDPYLAGIAAVVQTAGWAVQHGGDGEGQIEFSHTVGLTAVGHPEIIILGMPPDSAQAFLNLAGSLIRDEGLRFEHGTVTEEFIGPGAAVVFIDVIDDSNLSVVRGIYGSASAVQLIYPDSNGQLPWMSGYCNSPDAQPLLGIRPAGIINQE